TAFVGTLAPAFGFLLIQNLQVSAYAGSAKDVPQRGDNSASWMLVLVVSVALLWFNTGLFGVRPTVVSGVSMNPTFYAGDVVITRDVPVDDIEVGDIIRYQRHGVFILHRVVEIQDDPGGTWFIAKGDANNVLDDPIPANEIQGKVIAVIPKIGWVGVMVRRFFEWIF
ncbi:MAG: signal peptidase I, partial [Anaerolineales bacterium]|nr:signal peptidase I [Anaerolineales bacterium]